MSHELDKAMGKDLRVITERSGGAMGPGDSKVRQRNDPGQIAAEVAMVQGETPMEVVFLENSLPKFKHVNEDLTLLLFCYIYNC